MFFFISEQYLHPLTAPGAHFEYRPNSSSSCKIAVALDGPWTINCSQIRPQLPKILQNISKSLVCHIQGYQLLLVVLQKDLFVWDILVEMHISCLKRLISNLMWMNNVFIKIYVIDSFFIFILNIPTMTIFISALNFRAYISQ